MRRELSLIMLALASFWIAFARFVESFCRDDNLSAGGPVLAEIADRLLHGRTPLHTELFGGGGGAYLSPWLSGLLDPLAILPALVLRHDVRLLIDVVLALHLASFGGGGFFLAHRLGAPRWACRVAALSLGASGYFVIWGGNWSGVLLPYAFLPWLMGAVLGLVDATSRTTIIRYQALAACSLLLTFLTGLLFAPLYGGVALLLLLCAQHLRVGAGLKTWLKHLFPVAAVFVLLVAPALFEQRSLYDFLGGRSNDRVHWEVFSVPMSAYRGLFLPISSSEWRTVFFPDGVRLTNAIMSVGAVPAWFLLIQGLRAPSSLLQRHVLVPLCGLVVFLLVLSPPAFGLSGVFAQIPVLNAFRWPFRALPALHVLIVGLFAILAASVSAPPRPARALLPALAFGANLVAIGHDVMMIPHSVTIFEEAKQGAVSSWFRAAPMLQGGERWSDSTLATLRTSAYVANVCRSELCVYMSPHLYFYGLLGAEYHVPTVHLYVVPPFRAYAPLGIALKGALLRWDGVRTLIEQGLQAPPDHPSRWDDYRGPRTFAEILAKTYVGAIVVDPTYAPPMQYFLTSDRWRLLERRGEAVAFVRVP